MTLPIQFDNTFEALTGHRAFPWQKRLYEEHFACGTLPTAVDIPTGLGKTAVMALWLLAKATGASLPRRLVYVVDRRAVVDQATEFAEQLRKRMKENQSLRQVQRALGLGDRSLPISTLRGRHTDNREWMADPTIPAIIAGTVDMVGSRLLFEGYGLSRRMRPFAAGLLGCDTLVILDEAHLAQPFERLLKSIEEGQRRFSANGEKVGIFADLTAREGFPPLFRMLPLSATLNLESHEKLFSLNNDDRENCTVRARMNARKSLMIEDLPLDSGGQSLDQILAEQAQKLMPTELETTRQPHAVAIFCDRRKDAEKVANNLDKFYKGPGNGEFRPSVILFVGGRRIRERQMAAEELREHGLIGDSTRKMPVFLVATSAGEVGVDLDTDHMVCDLVAWERMVQRLGRVNRRGAGDAKVRVIDQGPPDAKKVGILAVDRHKAVRALLDALPQDEAGERQVGPGALADLASDPTQRAQIAKATTPMPLYPALTRPLVDAWAMTSLEHHAGRPEVTPWLRGWVERDEPQTTVVWRRYLPLRFQANGGDMKMAPKRDVRAFFAAAPPQTTELLETETSLLVAWLKKRATQILKKLPIISDTRDDEDPIESASLLAFLKKERPIAFVLDRANHPTNTLSLTEIDNKKRDDLHATLSGKCLVVDARIGGIEHGLLKEVASGKACTIEDNDWDTWNDSSETGPRNPKITTVLQATDVSGEWRTVLKIPYCVSAEGDAISWLTVQKRGGMGQSEDAKAVTRKTQNLDDHQQRAGEEAARIANTLGLNQYDKAMLIATARHHDNGKAAPRWQSAFDAPKEGGPYAKTTSPPNQHILNGYRHEFKSTLDAEKNGIDGLHRADTRFDLALHLIAAHHGHARPVIRVEGHDELPPSEAETAAHAIALRFARLQRELGPWGLAWWEALLRAADQAASRLLDEEST